MEVLVTVMWPPILRLRPSVHSSVLSSQSPGASVGGRGQCVIRCHQATRQACENFERRLKGREVTKD